MTCSWHLGFCYTMLFNIIQIAIHTMIVEYYLHFSSGFHLIIHQHLFKLRIWSFQQSSQSCDVAGSSFPRVNNTVWWFAMPSGLLGVGGGDQTGSNNPHKLNKKNSRVMHTFL